MAGSEVSAREAAESAGTPEFASNGDVDRLVCAHGAMFLVADRNGDVVPPGARELGLFYRDTRHLSHYALRLKDGDVVHLSAESTMKAHNQIDLMVSDLERETVLDDPRNFLHIRRRQLLDSGLVEQVVFTNFLPRRITIDVSFAFDADFVDMFEVRGARRARRGGSRASRVSDAGSLVFEYRGVCGTHFSTRIAFSPPPADVSPGLARFELAIEAGESATIEVLVQPSQDRDEGELAIRPGMFAARRSDLEEAAERFRRASTRFTCDDGLLQSFLDRATNDLYGLRLQFGTHTIVAAGIPWFCAPFGRDAILTSYEALLLNPELAEESLRTLAAFQGKKNDPITEEEPGRILHELRFGEMARAGEIPHTPYYGSIDATPLFVILADAVHRVTADRKWLEEMRSPVLAALRWIDAKSEDGKTLVTYSKPSKGGLDNQGWKDSRAGVPFPDGRLAEPPIALIEVQGYSADAYRRGARILATLGDDDLARTYAARATSLRALIEREMWLPEAGRYAFAVDGHGRRLPTVVSNCGHLLWSRAVSSERARATADSLLSPRSFSGFGVRTLASGQAIYNPLSYHNGTVWPHDNAFIARGMSNYDLSDQAARIFEGVYAAMAAFKDHRLPELFCGLDRASGPLVRYPVACSPQAWSSGALFLLLQAVLGLHVDAPAKTLTVRNPRLPAAVRTLELESLRIGASRVTLRLRQVGKRCHVDRLDVAGDPLKTRIEID